MPGLILLHLVVYLVVVCLPWSCNSSNRNPNNFTRSNSAKDTDIDSNKLQTKAINVLLFFFFFSLLLTIFTSLLQFTLLYTFFYHPFAIFIYFFYFFCFLFILFLNPIFCFNILILLLFYYTFVYCILALLLISFLSPTNRNPIHPASDSAFVKLCRNPRSSISFLLSRVKGFARTRKTRKILEDFGVLLVRGRQSSTFL